MLEQLKPYTRSTEDSDPLFTEQVKESKKAFNNCADSILGCQCSMPP